MLARPLCDQFRDPRQVGTDTLEFLPFILRCVQGKARKAEIGFRHFQAETGIQRKARFPQGAAENLPGVIAFVATGAGKPQIGRAAVKLHAPDEIEHQVRRGPGIHRKDESQRLPFPQREGRPGFGNEVQRFLEAIREPFSHIAAIAAS